MNLLEDPLAQKALALATKAHEGLKRKYSGNPYIEHPIEVAERIARLPWSTVEMVAASYLHDTVEDTDLTLADIERECGVVVAALVDGCTDKFAPENHPGNRKVRKQLEAERLGKETKHVKAIKLADIASNLRATDPNDPFSEVFLREKATLLPLIGGADAELCAEVERAGEVLRAAFDVAAAAKLAAKKAAKEKAGGGS